MLDKELDRNLKGEKRLHFSLPTRGFNLVVHDERHSRERRERPGYLHPFIREGKTGTNVHLGTLRFAVSVKVAMTPFV